jgi:hypothetical protein
MPSTTIRGSVINEGFKLASGSSMIPLNSKRPRPVLLASVLYLMPPGQA